MSTAASPAAIQPNAPLRGRLTVKRMESPTPLMRRITFDTRALSAFPATLPAQAIKLFVPGPQEVAVGRAYTVRAYRPAEHAADIDFLLHGHGPAASWAAQARIGETLEFTGPKSGFRLAPETEWVQLVGDACAIPAIGAILASLPPELPAQAVIAVRDADEHQALAPAQGLQTVRWVHADATREATLAALALALDQQPAPNGIGQVFLAAESLVVRTLRTRYPRTPTPENGFAGIQAMGYWKQGKTDYHDHQ